MSENSSNKILIGIIVFLIILLLGGGGVAFWYITKTPSNAEKVQTTQQQNTNSADDNLAEVGTLYPLKPITVNLKTDDETDVYLKITLSLELSSKELSKELDDKNAVIRDEMIRILSSKNLRDIDSELEKNKLCEQMKNSLNSMLVKGKIKNIYIVDFIIQ